MSKFMRALEGPSIGLNFRSGATRPKLPGKIFLVFFYKLDYAEMAVRTKLYKDVSPPRLMRP